jgi:hypothetical protein
LRAGGGQWVRSWDEVLGTLLVKEVISRICRGKASLH